MQREKQSFWTPIFAFFSQPSIAAFAALLIVAGLFAVILNRGAGSNLRAANYFCADCGGMDWLVAVHRDGPPPFAAGPMKSGRPVGGVSLILSEGTITRSTGVR